VGHQLSILENSSMTVFLAECTASLFGSLNFGDAATFAAGVINKALPFIVGYYTLALGLILAVEIFSLFKIRG
jgi:hypothetical protein